MPRIADYVIIKQDRFTLQTGGDIDKDFDFTLESGSHSGSRSILAFVLVKSGTGSLTLEVKVNGSLQLSNASTGARFNTLHEVIDADVLKVGTNNIVFRIIDGSGTLNISNVVLHYQRDI